MMTSRGQPLEKLQEYEKLIRQTEYDIASNSSKISHQARILQSAEDLRNSVMKQQAAIDNLKATSQLGAIDEPSVDLRQRLQQLRAIKVAYEKLTLQEPYKPFPDSPLPALFALRNSYRIIAESKTSIKITHEKLIETRRQSIQEEANLEDARLITATLEKRIDKLRQEYEQQSQKSPEEVANAMIQEQSSRKSNYEKDTKKLIRALVKFVNEHLAGMLAAEELGGPVVGDLLEVTDDMLEAGFSLQGKAKKLKISSHAHDFKRQKRIDQIWGHQDDEDVGARSERKAAAAEMRSLIEELLNAAAENVSQNTYVSLQRDSAAVRFLVRAKVAQFHPRDARKLRLINFGQGLDD